MMKYHKGFLPAFWVLLCIGAIPFTSRAQETGLTGAQYTEVVDAFDVGDPFDFHLSVQYEYSHSKSEVSRECYAGTCTESTISDYIYYEKVLESIETTHILDITGLIGIYHDLQLKVGLPIILQKSGSLKVHPDIAEADARRILYDPSSNSQIFNVPFTSADRSGIDYFVTGLEWGVLNQARNESWPDWNIFIEGLWGVGPIMKPAGHDAVNGDLGAVDDPGVSRGNLSIRGGSRLGKRFKYINPYFGFEFLIEFPKREAPYPYNNERVFDGQVNLKPPMKGYINFGLEIIPYEAPAKEQKFFIDLRFVGGYISEGRDYSPLFDALGTTQDPSLNFFKESDTYWAGKVGDTNFASDWNGWYGDGDALSWDATSGGYTDSRGRPYDPYAKETWTGLTDQENYGTFGGRFQVGFVTSKWFKIMAGVGIAYNQPHFITFTDECNSGTFERIGATDTNCTMGSYKNPDGSDGTSSFNPDYRVALDEPGNRFKLSSTLIISVFVHAVAMF
jgi:hypothetical protein